jgi:hypothetical protein
MTTARMALSLALALVGANVQAQECNANVRATTPTDRFVIDAAKGTVLDKKTGLMWKQCAEGQSGAKCATGAAQRYAWSDALTQAANSVYAGYSDWRLPNAKELESLVERKCFDPAINLSVFPDASSDPFWASSPSYADYSYYAWYVGFVDGFFYYSSRGNGYAVRLVRGGQ